MQMTMTVIIIIIIIRSIICLILIGIRISDLSFLNIIIEAVIQPKNRGKG